MTHLNLCRPAVMACLAAMIAGCAGSESPPTRYYVLSPMARPEATTRVSAQNGPIVVIGSVVVAEYLNQTDMLTLDTANQVTRAEYDKWASPLPDEITRVLGENLVALLPSDRIVLASSRRVVQPDAAIEIEIIAFERQPDDNARMTARWSIISGDGRRVIAMRRTDLRVPVASPSYASTAEALSKGVAELSQEIASALVPRRNGRADRASMTRR